MADDVYVWEYALRSSGGLNARSGRDLLQGVLVRSGDGFGCLQPWPELGDEPLSVQLEALQAGSGTPLVERTLACASADGDARRRGVSLFEGREMPRSHFTVPPGEFSGVPGGFEAVKLKGSPQGLDGLRERVLVALEMGLRVRLDFNGSLTEPDWLRWAEGLEIELVEDPFPFDREAWQRSERASGVAHWLDFGGGDWRRRVVKPAYREVPDHGEVIVTSAMDHVLGQYWAAWHACRWPGETHGVATHHLFAVDAFSERVEMEGSRLVAPGGTGLGFDDLLEGLPWRKL